jgi:hypothetical protein
LAHPDFSSAALGLGHVVFDADIFFPVVPCCAHGSVSGLRGRGSVLVSVSRLMTLLMNAHSIMADIRFYTGEAPL